MRFVARSPTVALRRLYDNMHESQTLTSLIWSVLILDICIGLPVTAVRIFDAVFRTKGELVHSILLDFVSIVVVLVKAMLLFALRMDMKFWRAQVPHLAATLASTGWDASSPQPQHQIQRDAVAVSLVGCLLLGMQVYSAGCDLLGDGPDHVVRKTGVIVVFAGYVAANVIFYPVLVLGFYRHCNWQRQLVLAAWLQRRARRCWGEKDLDTISKIAEQDSQEVCCICLSNPAAGEMVTTLPCGHSFHRACVGPWLKSHNHCPFRCPNKKKQASESTACAAVGSWSRHLATGGATDEEFLASIQHASV